MPSLRALVDVTCVGLVVTQPDRPAGRGHRLQATPVKAAALELGIEVITPDRLRPAVDALRAQRADLFAVASYGKIVPRDVLDLPRIGSLNVHPSLLPLYRGATPLQTVLRDGCTAGGVSIILMDEGMDTGDVVLQEPHAIGPTETFGELHDRFAAIGARMLNEAVLQAAAGTLVRTQQSTMGISQAEIAATVTKPLARTDLEIDWDRPAKRVVDQIRSLSPEPGARGRLPGDSRALKILSARVAVGAEVPSSTPRRPGSIDARSRNEPTVACGEGEIVLERVVPADRRPMSGREYAAMLRQSLART